MKRNKTVFTSNTDFDEAEFRAKMSGFQPIGKARNKRGQYVVFAVKAF